MNSEYQCGKPFIFGQSVEIPVVDLLGNNG
jgi:hypothetical protein